jgi:hemoglobin
MLGFCIKGGAGGSRLEAAHDHGDRYTVTGCPFQHLLFAVLCQEGQHAPTDGRTGMRMEIFERLGGFARVRLLVSDFYDRVRESETLAPCFDGIDMRRLIDRQTKFISSVTGGPASFTDAYLERSYRHLRIRPEHFDEMSQVLVETLEDANVDADIVARIAAQVTAVRERIVDAALARRTA